MINWQTGLIYMVLTVMSHSPSTVSLPIRADPYVITEFYVIDVESPYNAILGRPWIHMMKVIPSSYHQLQQYPTPTRTANTWGDRRCLAPSTQLPARSRVGCQKLTRQPLTVISL